MTEALTNTAEQAQAVEQAVVHSVNALTDEQRDQMSKALFPDTHTTTVMLLGEKRTLRPLPIKYSKQINALLSEFQSIVKASAEGADAESAIELDLLEHVVGVSGILATFYGWPEVQAAIDEEDVMLGDLQSLIVHQMHLQEMNDFLLMPLRVLVGVMQQAEIEMIRLQSIFSGLVS
jgi:hypothetical protein